MQKRNRQSDASGNVEQRQQNEEEQKRHRKKRKRLSADFVEYALTREQLNEKKSKGQLSYKNKYRKPVDTVDQPTPHSTNGERSKSDVWDLFQLIVDESTEAKNVVSNYVMCSSCNKLFSYNGETTTSLLRHSPCGKEQPTIKNFFVTKKETNFKEIDFKNIREAAVKFVVKDYRPYHAVECEGLKDLCYTMVELGQRYPNMSNHDFEKILPCRKTVVKDVLTKSSELINQFSKEMRHCINYAGGFASTVDLWTDKYKRKSYLSITVHLNIFKDERVIRKVYVINMDTVDCEIKDGRAIISEIKKVFQKYGVTPEEIIEKVTFVSDRGGNIVSALSDCELINCYAHFVNNIVHSMCKPDTIKEIITKAASLVRYVKICGLNDSFNISLKSYCETRFNTVVEMLESIEINYFEILEMLQKRQQASKQLDLISKVTCLNQSQLKSIVDFLKLFQLITTDLEGEKYVTIHKVWPAYRKIQKHLLSNENDPLIIFRMKREGIDYCKKNLQAFEPKLVHKIAVFLHPAFKSLNFVSNNEKQLILQDVRLQIAGAPDTQLDENSMISMNETRAQENSVKNKSNSLFDEFLDEEEIIDSAPSDELQRYIEFKATKIPDIELFDLFGWWVQHAKFFPTLFKLFLRTSCIPATSCPSERAFSSTSNTITAKRNCLIPDNVNALSLVANSYKYKNEK